MPESKQCPKCREFKPRTGFARVRASRTGLAGWCRTCCNEGMRSLRKADPIGSLLVTTRASAKKRGIPFTLTRPDLALPERCPLLGIEFSSGIGTGQPNDGSPTIDRIDNTQGYVPGNVWVVSHKANRIKNNATVEEMELVLTNWKKHLG